MSDFFSRLAERAQGKVLVAEPLIPSHFAPSSWPAAGDPVALAQEDVSRRAAPAKRPNAPVATPAPPRASGSEDPEEAGSVFSGPLLHSESDALEPKAEGGDYTSRSSDTTPETASKPVPPHMSRENPGERQPSISQERAPAVTPQPVPQGEVLKSPSSPAVKMAPGGAGETGPVSQWPARESRRSTPGGAAEPRSTLDPVAEYAPSRESAQTTHTTQRSSVSQERGPTVQAQPGHGKETADSLLSPVSERSGAGPYKGSVKEEERETVSVRKEQTRKLPAEPAAMESSWIQSPWAEQAE
jgi:hypothetical protein